MPLNKSVGNMYQGWVTHTHNHLGGACSHKCSYCYVDNPRFGRPERYKGELRLIEKEFSVNYGSGKTIFMENMNDLFANDVPQSFIWEILVHCQRFPDNTYVFQTKNPMGLIGVPMNLWPKNVMWGTTIETNRSISEISKAPSTEERADVMRMLSGRKFITIEPIMVFDLDKMLDMIVSIKPEFINIGADSKNKGLPEPTWLEVMALINRLKKDGIEVREKSNLDRLKKL
jgi:protein gp37